MAMTVREFARSDQWEKRNETNVRSSTGDSRRSRLGIRDPGSCCATHRDTIAGL